MRYLYLDNFRGFNNTFVPLQDVNFLVGENSTGKTSFLSILKLLSTFDFWSKQDFNINPINLGSFTTIASSSSGSQSKEFQVGLIESQKNIEEFRSSIGFPGSMQLQTTFLLKFRPLAGVPVLSDYFYMRETDYISVHFSPKQVRYKKTSFDSKNAKPSEIIELVQEWAQTKYSPKGSRTLNVPIKFIEGQKILMARSYISSLEGDDMGDSFVFGTPLGDIAWFGPIRSEPRRTYDSYTYDFSPEGEHTPYIVMRVLEGDIKQKVSFLSGIEEFGKKSGLFETITVKKFGRTLASPFELHIRLNDTSHRIVDVGYGVSQVLPLVVELFSDLSRNSYAIQQPEVHLHPKAQAALGNIFYTFSTIYNNKFFIETHSDYLVDRFRLQLKNDDLNEKRPSAQILFFERTSRGNKITPIEINERGQYSELQPDGFRDFFIQEELHLLGV